MSRSIGQHAKRVGERASQALPALAALTALAVLTAPSAAGQTVAEELLYVGIMRADGIVLPIADYRFSPFEEERGWRPLSQSDWMDVIYDVKAWHLVTRDGERASLVPGSVVTFPYDPYDSWGQLTDYAPRELVPPNYYPKRRIGVAVTRPVPLVPLLELEEGSPLRIELAQRLTEEFRVRETAALSEIATTQEGSQYTLGHPVDPEARRGASLEVKLRLADLPGDGPRPIRFELRALYEPGPPNDPMCPGQTWMWGWLIERDGGWQLLEADLAVTECEGKGLVGIEPLAFVVIEERPYLIGLRWAWESSDPAIFELGETGFEEVAIRK